MSQLPVAAVLPELLSALQQAPQVLLNAPTGAGKSTWLPLQILADGHIDGRIILLEPRRLAARNVAQRLAELLGEAADQVMLMTYEWGYTFAHIGLWLRTQRNLRVYRQFEVYIM